MAKQAKAAGTSSWEDYYTSYKQRYLAVFQQRWALGAATFARHLHHTAIPDASGSLSGWISWAVYSQPSADSMLAFLEIFRELLRAEPHRVRNHRYLFFVPEGKPVPPNKVRIILGELSARLDFWTDALEAALEVPHRVAVLDGLSAILAEAGPWVSRETLRSTAGQPGRVASGVLDQLRSAVAEKQISSRSVMTRDLGLLWVDSTFLLAAFNLGLNTQEATELCAEDPGIAAHLAFIRADRSGWDSRAGDFCREIIRRHSPKTFEYKVAPGEILSRIVRSVYELPFQSVWPLIEVLNPELRNPDLIRPGQIIRLPVIKKS